MKRYTSFTDDYPVVTSDHCWEDQNEDYCGPAIERLAEYESTGLMPAEVAALQYQLRHAMGVQRWIPVTERLPEDDLPKGSKVKQIKVLTALKSDKGVRTVRSQMRYRCTWYSDSEPWTWKYSGSEITHWMPLPEPPKEKSHG